MERWTDHAIEWDGTSKNVEPETHKSVPAWSKNVNFLWKFGKLQSNFCNLRDLNMIRTQPEDKTVWPAPLKRGFFNVQSYTSWLTNIAVPINCENSPSSCVMKIFFFFFYSSPDSRYMTDFWYSLPVFVDRSVFQMEEGMRKHTKKILLFSLRKFSKSWSGSVICCTKWWSCMACIPVLLSFFFFFFLCVIFATEGNQKALPSVLIKYQPSQAILAGSGRRMEIVQCRLNWA